MKKNKYKKKLMMLGAVLIISGIAIKGIVAINLNFDWTKIEAIHGTEWYKTLHVENGKLKNSLGLLKSYE